MSRDGSVESIWAEFRAVARAMAMPRLPTLLTYKEAARELGLKSVSQFKARYVATGRIDVCKEDGMQPRVPSSEIHRIVSEMRDTASRRTHGSVQTGQKPTRTRSAAAPDVEADVARLRAELKKRRQR